MNQSVSTYCPTTLTATTFGVFFYDSSTGKERDEETDYGYFGTRRILGSCAALARQKILMARCIGWRVRCNESKIVPAYYFITTNRRGDSQTSRPPFRCRRTTPYLTGWSAWNFSRRSLRSGNWSRWTRATQARMPSRVLAQMSRVMALMP